MRSLGHWQLLCPPWTGTDPPDLHPRGPSPARAADILLNTADESLSPPELEPEPCHCAGNDPHARAGRTPHLGPSFRPSARPTPINRCLARTRQHGNDTPLGSGKFFNLPPQGLGGLARHSARSTLARHWAPPQHRLPGPEPNSNLLLLTARLGRDARWGENKGTRHMYCCTRHSLSTAQDYDTRARPARPSCARSCTGLLPGSPSPRHPPRPLRGHDRKRHSPGLHTTP